MYKFDNDNKGTKDIFLNLTVHVLSLRLHDDSRGYTIICLLLSENRICKMSDLYVTYMIKKYQSISDKSEP